MYTGEMDTITLIIYIVMGVIAVFLFRRARVREPYELYDERKNNRINRYYVIFFVLFLVFAVFRKVDTDIGGADALGYATYFQSGNIPIKYQSTEQLYGLFIKFLHIFFSNYKLYFIVIYGLFLIAYVVFFRRYSDKDNIMIPMMLIMIPYLKSFNTIRSAIAIAVFLLALTQIEKRKILSLLMIVSTFFIHRMSIIFIPIWFFYWFMKKWARVISKWKLIVFAILIISASVVVATYMRTYIMAAGILDSTDTWYLTINKNKNWIGRYYQYGPHLLLLIALVFFDKNVEKTNSYNGLKLICLYDIAVMPASLIMGFWRSTEYLYIARLIMWGYLLKIPERKLTKDSRIFYRAFIFILFLAWLYIKIRSEWDDCKLMPYIFDPFNSI